MALVINDRHLYNDLSANPARGDFNDCHYGRNDRLSFLDAAFGRRVLPRNFEE